VVPSRVHWRTLLRPALLAALLLAGAGQARAGYVPALGFDRSESAGSCLVDRSGGPGDDGVPADRVGPNYAPRTPLAGLLGHSPRGGSGMGGSGNGPTTGAGHQAGCSASPDLPRPRVTGILFLQDLAERPPPFVAPIFHPPRLS
jgi:hypothetical protein